MMDAENAFSKVINGTFVITSGTGARTNGMTAAWVTRVSHVPPLIAVSVGHSRYTRQIIDDAGAFCVNVLSSSQLEIGKRFGFVSGKNEDKLEGIRHEMGELGCPILEGVAAHMECKVIDALDAGDHTVYIGEVIAAGCDKDKDGLVARMSDYR